MAEVSFSGQEILKIAIEIERNGRSFYETLSEKRTEDQLKSLFSYLAGEEVKHKKTFQEMLDDAEEQGQDLSSRIFGQLEEDYLAVLADSQIFTPTNEKLEEAKEAASLENVIDIAIGIELDSILYYHEMRDAMKSNDKEAVTQILEEERNHVRKLINLTQ